MYDIARAPVGTAIKALHDANPLLIRPEAVEQRKDETNERDSGPQRLRPGIFAKSSGSTARDSTVALAGDLIAFPSHAERT